LRGIACRHGAVQRGERRILALDRHRTDARRARVDFDVMCCRRTKAVAIVGAYVQNIHFEDACLVRPE
jgi:hypothetical protein